MHARWIFAVSATLCVSVGTARADAVTDWNEKAVALVVNRGMPPAAAERIVAMAQIAMFDAVNSVQPRYHPYLVQITPERQASPEAAAIAAAATVLTGVAPDSAATFKAAMTAALAGMPDDAAKDEGIRLGEAVATKALQARAEDGAAAADAYRPRTQPGVYIPTASTASSMWPHVTPFAMTSPAQFRPGPPVALDSAQWIADYNEIKAFGARNSTQRSVRQTEDARFWLMVGPATYYPLVRQIVAARHMSLIDCARFMALVSVAEADAYIAVFDAKYTYEFWRPITAIRNGDTMNTAAMQRDATWVPIADTPMHPEYPCAHCITSVAFASVVEALFGSTEVPNLSITSLSLPGITHYWSSLDAYTTEVAEARIWAGFHYRTSTQVGQDMGRQIGRYVVATVMQPL
jgi:hypothetical protein